MSKSPTVAIIGGGIAGLASAYYLAQKATLSKVPNLRILLLERSSRFGGWIHSKQLDAKYDSHIFEKGARTLRLQSGISSLDNYSTINTLKLLEQLNIYNEQFCPIEKQSSAFKNRLIYYHKKLININDLSSIYGGKPLRYPPVIYLLYEYFSKKGRYAVQDETIKSFIYRRFGDVLGEDIVEYLLDPLLKGIYAGDVASLSARSVFKKLFELEQTHGSLIEGLVREFYLKNNQNEQTTHSILNDLNLNDYSSLSKQYAIYYLKDGMETLIKALVNSLQTLPNVELKTNEIIRKIHFFTNDTNSIEIETQSNENSYHVDYVISAIPSFELANIIDHSKYEMLRSRLNRIAFVNMIVINLLYENEAIFPKEAFGYLIPTREKSHLLGVLFDSCIRNKTDRNKRGSHLTVMMGGAWYDELRLGQWTDEKIMQIVTDELKQQMNLQDKPSFYSISRLNQAIPNYNVGHQTILDDINALIRRDRLPLTLVGNSYRGIGVSDVIYDARLEIEYLNLKTKQSK